MKLNFCSHNTPKQAPFTQLICLCMMLGLGIGTVSAQYVSPNQPGRAGVDHGTAKGDQVAVTTRIGLNIPGGGLGGIIAANKVTGSDKKVLNVFQGFLNKKGAIPYYTTPFQGTDGKLYGPTYHGGTSFYDFGVVYSFDPANCTETVVHSNTPAGGTGGGGGPGYFGNVNELSDGKIYIVHEYGGKHFLGSVSRMNKDGSNYETLYSFRGGLTTNATYTAGAIESIGGVANNPFGAASCTASPTITIKYDGAYPRGFITEGSDGKIYGTTFGGGTLAQGTVFRMSKDGSNYEIISVGGGPGYFKKSANYQTSIFELQQNSCGKVFSAEGLFCHPWSNVTEGQDGKLYVTGVVGGSAAIGSVGRFDKDGGNPEIVHSFRAELGREDGQLPYRGALIIDNKIFGTCAVGRGLVGSNGITGLGTVGTLNVGSIGTVWSMDLDGGNYTRLHKFGGVLNDDGSYPYGGLIYDGTYMYGATYLDGVRKISDSQLGALVPIGAVYRLKPDGSDFKVVLTASGSSDCNDKLGYQYGPGWERVTLVDAPCADNNSCRISACNAGTKKPALSAFSASNTCPTTTVSLNGVTATNLPSGTTMTWHTGTPATAANVVSNPAAVGAGIYYAAFKDATNNCYGGDPAGSATAAYTVTVTSCGGVPAYTAPNPQSIVSNQAVSGDAAAESAPSGGTGPYKYTNGNAEPGCVAPSGATVLPNSSNLVVNLNGTYSYTAPAATGKYYFCVKVCDSTNSTPNCNIVTYTINVAAGCQAGSSAPGVN